jgi:enterochelin esterase family protein
VNNILDNLIAQKKAVSMVVVMPYGNISVGSSAEAPSPSSGGAADMYKVFNEDLVGSIMPYVEENYRHIPNRNSRAIGGL